MRDGVELAADVYVPGGEGPFPTLLQRTPYDKTDPFGTQFIVQMTIVRALDAGFAVVVQDTRGRFASAGAFDPFVHEAEDGADTVAWIRSQDFSDGRVASYGASYVGATQMLLAMQGAEGHVAMAPFLTTGDYHQHWAYRDGALQLGLVYLWITEALGPIDVEKRQLAVDDPARQTLSGLLADPREAMDRLPVLADDMVQLAPYLADWLGNPMPDRWWSAHTPLAHAEAIRTPALHIAGFNDIFLEGSLRSYETLRRHGATPEVRDGQYLVIGPWSHGNIGDWQGDLWHGYEAAAPALDLTGMQLAFFTAVLEGRRPELPRVRYFTSGVNEWRTGEEWPPAAEETTLHLAAAGRLVARPEDEEGVDRYVSDPLDPVPTAGGATFLPGLLLNRNDGPKPQEAVEARDDVLVYRGEVLADPVEVTGLVTLELWASSSATDCDWTARLTDVDEADHSIGLVDGILRARYRHGGDPTPLIPGEVECFTVELGHISHLFAAGHRIGLQVASSNFPRFDRNSQQMVDPVRAQADDFVVARQSVIRGGARPSRLLLPTVSRSDDRT
jgi:hypothetical protein